MTPETELANTLAKALETEPVKNLLSPFTKEVGELLGTLANVAKFYMTENIGNVFTKWARNRRIQGKVIEAEDIKRVMPLFPQLSLQGDDELQERWAALLESFVSDSDGVQLSFGQVLAQMSPNEARFLDRLAVAFEKADGEVFIGQLRGEMNFEDLRRVYDVRLTYQVGPPDFQLNPQTDHRDPDLMVEADFMIDDLLRLGILRARTDADTSGSIDELSTFTWNYYSLSPYGQRFIKAVTPSPRKPDDN